MIQPRNFGRAMVDAWSVVVAMVVCCCRRRCGNVVVCLKSFRIVFVFVQELLTDIACPTLIIHGDKDPMVGDEHPQFLLKNIKNSKLINVTEGKHNLHLKFAEEFNKRAKYFLLNG